MRDFIAITIVSLFLTSFTFHQLHQQGIDQQEEIVWTR